MWLVLAGCGRQLSLEKLSQGSFRISSFVLHLGFILHYQRYQSKKVIVSICCQRCCWREAALLAGGGLFHSNPTFSHCSVE